MKNIARGMQQQGDRCTAIIHVGISGLERGMSALPRW
jgi:hypothetical protein